MKLNYDLDFVFNITRFDKQKIYRLMDYFSNLPIYGKIEVLAQMKEIEEENEGGFFLQHYDKNKIGEYRFTLFLLAADWLYQFENKDDLSKKPRTGYALRKLKRLKYLRALEKDEKG